MTQEKVDNGVTEDEAALYDRQIRLWGLEAQGRIRSSHILVINLDGLTTEAIKNWVLAGIQRLTLIDFRDEINWNDLSAGFFWREEDVEGKSVNRLIAAAERIQILNPLVKIDVLPSSSLSDLLNPSSTTLSNLKPTAMVVGVPSGPQCLSNLWDEDSLTSINNRARQLGIPLYISGSQGLNGYIFCDLGDSYEYVIEKNDPNAVKNPIKATTDSTNDKSNATPSSSSLSSNKLLIKKKQEFVPLQKVLKTTWKELTPRQIRFKAPKLGYYGVLASWRLAKSKKEGEVPSREELSVTCLTIMEERGIDLKGLHVSNEEFESFIDSLAISISQSGEFSPTCAILGGILSQEVLNAVGGKQEPIVNWLQFEGLTGQGLKHAISTLPSVIVSSSQA